ncbi:Ku protein [Streptomyces caeruleatus]|uniref:non-homologous end joining protein Ku n=1 Tax=Streptomyces caeruleatus TaxID=661399 RepID=UPI0007C836A3|nr:Ku protein [Streptomyces caeruleatus]
MPGPVIWNGHIVFGLISVPVGLVKATECSTTPLHLVHTAGGCLGRIRYRKVCELDGQALAEHQIGRGYETPTGIVPLTDADLDNLPIATARAIQLVAAIPAARIDPREIGAGGYYLAADSSPATARPYTLLVRALKRRSQVAIVKYATRGDRERLGMLRPLGDVLVLNGLLWPEEVRDVESGIAPAPADINEAELAAALELVDTLSADELSDIDDLTDHYAQALAELVEAKVHVRELTQPSAPPQREQLVDLMAALQQSVHAARARRGEHLDPNGVGPGTSPCPPGGPRAPSCLA